MDKSLFFAIKEQYNHDIFLPASLLSDGTISVTALIIALYFEHMPFIIFEEPERNIHPSLLTKIVNMMKEVSREKQIIVTTHNSQIAKHADLENLLFISRDKHDFSTISIPSQQEDIRVFLKNEIGVEDLFIQGLLGA